MGWILGINRPVRLGVPFFEFLLTELGEAENHGTAKSQVNHLNLAASHPPLKSLAFSVFYCPFMI